MSTIESLSIRGIRNFGVDTDDEQKITFTAPLTLIVGQNGSGKTTIIECIKYALTGETPPNCPRNVGFINNPHTLHRFESSGEVKLRLKSLQNIEMTICRSAKAVDRNCTYKSLDLTISENDNVPKKFKNDEATKHICRAIGVSKAIISNVLFCHQEDSDWPLSTDGQLMARFDQIFGITECNNLLEKLRDKWTIYEAKIKDNQSNLNQLKIFKNEANNKNMDIKKYEEEIKLIMEDIEKCETDLQPLNEEYQNVLKTIQQYSSIVERRTKVQTELENEEKNARNCRYKIQNIFTGDEGELQQEIHSLESIYLQKQHKISENKQKLNNAQDELNDILERHRKQDRKHHMLVQDILRGKKLHKERAGYIQSLCADLNMNAICFDIENDHNRTADLVANIRSKLSEEQANIQKIADNNEKENAEQEQEIREHCGEKIRIESDIASINKQLKDLEQSLAKHKHELESSEQNAQSLIDIQKEIEEIEIEIDKKTTSTNTQATRDEIAQQREERQKLAQELEEIDEQITYLSSKATVLAQTKEKQIEKRDSEVRRIKNKHYENLQRLFPDDPIESGFKRKIDALGTKLQTEVNRLEAEIGIGESKIHNFKAQLQSKKQELQSLENEQRKLEGEIDRVCEQTPFEDVLAETKDSVARWQMEHSSYKSSHSVYKRFIDKITKEPCCPVCEKDMNHKEVEDSKNKLKKQIEQLPQNIERSEKELKMETKKLEKLLAMQGSVERIEKLKSDLLPKIRNDIKDLESNLLAANEKVKQSQRSVEEPREKREIVGRMVGDMSLLDSDGPNDNDLESRLKKRTELSERIKALQKDIDQNEERCHDHDKQIMNLQKKVISLKQEEVKLQGESQKCITLKVLVEELSKQIIDLKEKKATSDQALAPILERIKNAKEKRCRSKASGDEKYNIATTQLKGLEKKFDLIERLSKEIENLILDHLGKEIEQCANSLNELKERKTNQEAMIDSICKNTNVLQRELVGQEIIKRDLNENLELKRCQDKIAEKTEDLEILVRQDQEMNFEKNLARKATLECDMEKIRKEQTRMHGQIEAKQDIVEKLRTEVSQPEYRDSQSNYTKSFHKDIVLKGVVQDLKTFSETTEKAITKFHSEKMEKINSLIRDLWQDIYNGNDIDFIQIKPKDIGGTSKRKEYKYRVEASKNDAIIDFRGHSSAGQRVLACLIIRIALAETFSGHCGVLALDEPTTNLDKSNIKSLCEALNRIVEERGGQYNFKLIVITHDVEFIKLMHRVESYTHVYRDKNNGKSCTEIKRTREG